MANYQYYYTTIPDFIFSAGNRKEQHLLTFMYGKVYSYDYDIN